MVLTAAELAGIDVI
jgi:molecular chaperone DnaK (HSP70)